MLNYTRETSKKNTQIQDVVAIGMKKDNDLQKKGYFLKSRSSF